MPEVLLVVPPELRFLLPLGRREGELPVRADPTDTVGHVVQSAGIPLTEVGALLLDDVAVGRSARVREGRLAVLPVARPQRAPTDPPRFLLDVHLGSLARRLRVLGVDTAYDRQADDADLAARSAAEQRVLLTQDRGLLKRAAVVAGALVRGTRADEQLDDVLDRFAPPLAPRTRCVVCNGRVRPVPASEVTALLEPGPIRTVRDFGRCERCGRVYWRGAHDRRLDPVIARAEQIVRRRATHPEGG